MHRAAELNQALMNLRYKGKSMFGKNLRRIRTLFGAFAQELSKDMAKVSCIASRAFQKSV